MVLRHKTIVRIVFGHLGYIYKYIYIYISGLSLQPRDQAQRLANMFGFGPISNEKPGSHLPFDVPELEAVRTYIQNQVRSYRYILAMYAILTKYGLRSSDPGKNLGKKTSQRKAWPKISGRDTRL